MWPSKREERKKVKRETSERKKRFRGRERKE